MSINLEEDIKSQKGELLESLQTVKSLNEVSKIKIKYLKKYVKSLYEKLRSV